MLTMHSNGHTQFQYTRPVSKEQCGISLVTCSPIELPTRRWINNYAFYVLFAQLTEMRMYPCQYSLFSRLRGTLKKVYVYHNVISIANRMERGVWSIMMD